MYEKPIIYLNTIANYSIWRHRNDIRYKLECYDLEMIVRKMVYSTGARKSVDLNTTDSFKIPYINQLYDAMIVVSLHYPFDRG